MMKRREFIVAAGAALLTAPLARANPLPRVTVAKSPSCGCCTGWVDHMRAAGFEVTVQNVDPDELDRIKRRIGLRPELTSCHTASVDGYFVEGHVPAEDVKRLLAERPAARGLTAPGMPIGSPGMEMDGRRDPYDTLLVGSDGRVRVFASHP